MAKEICGIIPPRQDEMVEALGDGYLAHCILPNGHLGQHLVRTPEGKYFSWEFDLDCNCNSTGAIARMFGNKDGDNGCYVHNEIDKKEAEGLLIAKCGGRASNWS